MGNQLGKWHQRNKNIKKLEELTNTNREIFFENCTRDDLKRIWKKSPTSLQWLIDNRYFSRAIHEYHQSNHPNQCIATIVQVLHQDKKLLQWVLKSPLQFKLTEADLKAGFYGSKPKDPFYRMATDAYKEATSWWTDYKDRRYRKWHQGKPHPDTELNDFIKNAFNPDHYQTAQQTQATTEPTPKKRSPKRSLLESFNASHDLTAAHASPLPHPPKTPNSGNRDRELETSFLISVDEEHAEHDETVNASIVFNSGGPPFRPANDSILVGSGKRGNNSRFVDDSPSLHPSADLRSPGGGSELPSFQSAGVKVEESSELPSFIV